ncbi:cytochrome P450 [Linderina pennispora]|uniref:Cytochrome P450 n=1 Tax=Linderina pennispora TaxID=61395 RepID=A0A1Y1W5H7_9FUNG|nr:cytochrome P450 [Linderina pennispora]ORX68652.1 cytochrome P450 [Linderina pennispora]
MAITSACNELLTSSVLWTVALLAASVYLVQLVHTAFFSPLAQVPGPLLNKFSNLPLKYHVIRGQYHSYTSALHAKYGEIVRIGYNHVSLSNTSDARLVLATHAFLKGPMYEKGHLIEANTFSTIDPEENKIRRRQIGSAFAMHTMRAVEDTVVDAGANSLISVWDAEISKQGGAAKVNYFYSFHRMGYDVIGAIGFGESFNILKTGNTDVIDWMQDTVHLKSFRSLSPMLVKIPWLFSKLKHSHSQMVATTLGRVEMRKRLIKEAGAPPRVDVLQKFIDAEDPVTGDKLTLRQLQSEVALMLVAGTDTTSNTITYAIVHLLHNPSIYKRVTEEVRSTFPDSSQVISFEDAKAKLSYLSAVIYETMRINPSVSGMLPRSAPAKGATIQGYNIPHDTQICVSIAACHRNPHTWKNPDVFDPERFLGPDSAERVKDILVFSSGVRVCIGRNLAWLEIYTVLANILRKYDFSLPADAPYGPHRLGKSGAPVEIPAVSHIVTNPENPKDNCWAVVRPAMSA